jgi:hypothetical protein
LSRRAEARPRPGPSALPPTRWPSDWRCTTRVVPSSRCQTAQSLRSRDAFLRQGSLLPLHSTPERGVGGAPGGASLELVALVRRDTRLRGVHLPRNREAASRRSTVALSAQEPLPSPALLPAPARRLHATWHVCRPRHRASRIRGLRAAVDATSCSAVRIVSGDAPHERGRVSCSIAAFRSQLLFVDIRDGFGAR